MSIGPWMAFFKTPNSKPVLEVNHINNLIVDVKCRITNNHPASIKSYQGPLDNGTNDNFSEGVNVCVTKSVSDTMSMSHSLSSSKMSSCSKS